MFKLYHHHDLERLAELLAVQLSAKPRAHVLDPDTVIVPDGGVARWLRIQLASSEGIAANLQLPLLAQFIWKLLPDSLSDRPDSRPFEREALRWHLYRLLPGIAVRVPEIAAYLNHEPADVLRLQLAGRLADVFDEYLIYRPGMLAQWEHGRNEESSPGSWQAVVWQALTAELGTSHRGALLRRFLRLASENGGRSLMRNHWPDSVFCFALGTLPPDYLRFLYALGQHVDVHFLMPNPCQTYWGDIATHSVRLADSDPDAADEAFSDTGNPMLASMGRGTRDLLRVLYSEELRAIQEPDLGAALAYTPPSDDHLLAQVQCDIIAMDQPSLAPPHKSDRVSVQIHACHGPLREVQVLHDQLLDLMTRDPQLQPRDVLVMSPDISAYVPAISSVFGSARDGRYLPFTLSGHALGAEHPIVLTFRQLLDLPLSRWGASEVLELVSVPAVARRFELDPSGLELIRRWVQDAGVRWGLDGQTRADFGADPSDGYSWQFGLDRLLLGLCLDDEHALVGGVVPWPGLEGGAGQVLGRLWHVLEQLRGWAKNLAKPGSATQWQDRLNTLIDELIAPDPQDQAELSAISELRTVIAGLGEAATSLGPTPLPRSVIRETLLESLSNPGVRQPRLNGGVNFCNLMTLRGVPFRVICLLGMNDGSFPRRESHPAFNALRQRPQLGDFSRRDDDRLFFLQTLMAARDVFYISYRGQDVASGEQLPPAAVVSEWLEVLKLYREPDVTATDALVTQQPMHPFSPRLFTRTDPENSRLFTFAQAWEGASTASHAQCEPAAPFLDARLPRANGKPAEPVELTRLRRFFDNPARACLREVMQLDLDALDEDPTDEEPLQLDGLASWQVRDTLFRMYADDPEMPVEPDAIWRGRALLPPSPLDAACFAREIAQVAELKPVRQAWLESSGARPGWVDIDLEIESYRLVGRIQDVWSDGLRQLRVGSMGMKYRLRAWIDYLAYRAAGHEGDLQLAGISKRKLEKFTGQIEPDQAKEQLVALLNLYQDGQHEPLLVMPEIAETFLKSRAKGGDQAGLNNANSKLLDSRQPNFEFKDPYFHRILRSGEHPLGPEPGATPFCDLASRICDPVLAFIQKVDNK